MPRKSSAGERAAQVIWSLITLAIALIPLWFWLVIKHMVQPQGFWQNLAIAGLGMFFLGSIQIILLVLWVVLICTMWE